MNPDLQIAAVAAKQHSTFSIEQARAVGFTDAMVFQRRKSGRWGLLQPGVFRLVGTPPTAEQSLFGAWLAGGPEAALSHTAAAFIAELPVPDWHPELTVPRSRRPRLRRVTVHRSDNLGHVDVVEARGMRVTTPTRTAIDLCGVLALDDLVEVFDHLFMHRLSTPAYVARRNDALPSRGRAGAANVALLLARYAGVDHLIRTKAERELLRLLASVPGLTPIPQCPIRLPNGRIIHADVGLSGPRVAMELQSYTFHAGLSAHARDNERAVEVIAAGWKWFPVTPWDVSNRPAWVLDRLGRVAGIELGTDFSTRAKNASPVPSGLTETPRRAA